MRSVETLVSKAVEGDRHLTEPRSDNTMAITVLEIQRTFRYNGTLMSAQSACAS